MQSAMLDPRSHNFTPHRIDLIAIYLSWHTTCIDLYERISIVNFLTMDDNKLHFNLKERSTHLEAAGVH